MQVQFRFVRVMTDMLAPISKLCLLRDEKEKVW